jgi:hypothetical protein
MALVSATGNRLWILRNAKAWEADTDIESFLFDSIRNAHPRQFVLSAMQVVYQSIFRSNRQLPKEAGSTLRGA